MWSATHVSCRTTTRQYWRHSASFLRRWGVGRYQEGLLNHFMEGLRKAEPKVGVAPIIGGWHKD